MPVGRVSPSPQPWNKGLLVGQKKPLEPKHVWSIRVRLEIAGSKRDLAIFNLAIDSKLRACDLVKLRLDGSPVLDTSSQVGFTRALKYRLGNMPGWCTVGSKASAWSELSMARIR
jgi:hypothetical protein